jgi:hypothetical protein
MFKFFKTASVIRAVTACGEFVLTATILAAFITSASTLQAAAPSAVSPTGENSRLVQV